MKKILLILLLIIGIVQAKEEKSLMWMLYHPDIFAKETIIDGEKTFQMDFDEDGILDSIILDLDKIKIKSNKNIWTVSYYNSFGFSINVLLKYKDIFYFFEGGNGTDFGEITVYLYDKKYNNWFNIANIDHYKDENRLNHYDEDIFTEQQSVDGTIIKIKDKNSLLEIASNIKLMFEQKRFEDIKKVIKSVPLQIDDLSTKNLSSYNDIAYYLQQSNANEEAIFLLEKILEKFPNRTVAYLNLADAYNGVGSKEKAKINFEKYISLMKQDGKESKIPQRVLEYK